MTEPVAWHILRFEHRHYPRLPRRLFWRRMLAYFAMALALLLGSLFAGMTGYHFLENMTWLDAFLNAAMIMGGMGPVQELHTDGGKFFAGCYALYAGLMLITSVSLLIAPVAHRLLHSFHAEKNGKP